MFVRCADQAEVDRLWKALTDGGRNPSAGGWSTGSACRGRSSPIAWVSCWGDPDPARAQRAMQAMLQMQK